MRELEEAILKYGIVLPGDILNISSFLNNQVNIDILNKMADYIANYFKDQEINKVMTIEASGIAIATAVSMKLNCNMVFVKKSKTLNIPNDVYVAHSVSFTHKEDNTLLVPKAYLTKEDKVLIIDDFLANGEALRGLLSLCESAGSKVVGVGICVEKGFLKAGDQFRDQGINLLSLAIIDKMEDGNIIFRKN